MLKTKPWIDEAFLSVLFFPSEDASDPKLKRSAWLHTCQLCGAVLTRETCSIRTHLRRVHGEKGFEGYYAKFCGDSAPAAAAAAAVYANRRSEAAKRRWRRQKAAAAAAAAAKRKEIGTISRSVKVATASKRLSCPWCFRSRLL